MANLIVSCVVFWLSVPFTTYAAWNVRQTAVGDDISSGIISGTNGQDDHESDEDPLIE